MDQGRKDREKHPEPNLGLISVDLTLSEENSAVSCMFLYLWHCMGRGDCESVLLYVAHWAGGDWGASEAHDDDTALPRPAVLGGSTTTKEAQLGGI